MSKKIKVNFPCDKLAEIEEIAEITGRSFSKIPRNIMDLGILAIKSLSADEFNELMRSKEK